MVAEIQGDSFMGTKFQRLREVLAETGLTRTRLYSLMAEGKFPRPVSTSERAVAWLESETEAWKRTRVAERDERLRKPRRRKRRVS